MELPNVLEVPRCQRSNPHAEVPLIPLLIGEHPRLVSRTTEGSAMITNFRFCVFEKRLTINIPLLMVGDLLVNESTRRLRIGCKDAATYSCTFASVDDCQACTSMLREMLGGPKSISDLFAYRFCAAAMFQQKTGHPVSGQLVEKAILPCRPDQTFAYNFYKEMKRLGFDTSEQGLWRISRANENYEFCQTYPKYHILPATVDDDKLKVSLDFRALKRFPSVVWRDQSSGMVLIRSSQPLPSFLGVSYFTNHADVFLIEEIVNACNRDRLAKNMTQGTLKLTELECEASGQCRQENGHLVNLNSLTNGDTAHNLYDLPVAGRLLGKIYDGNFLVEERRHQKLAIVDCRSLAGVWGNSFKGGGTEDEVMYKCDTEHLDLANIHTVRDSFHKLKAACHAYQEATFHKNLANSLWLAYISALLRGANIVVELMYVKQRPVLVHCSDGWDRTSQIVSLSELMMDPYHRTFEGFQVLVEKEWLHFGHKFAERGGHDPKCGDSSQVSPIFLQFLDCVYQLTRQYPAIFQFNELYLVKLLRHSQACLFGTFLHNCQKDREKLEHLTASVWSLLTPERDQFINPLYQRTNQVLKARCCEEEMCLWKTVYVAGSSHSAEMDFYSDGVTVLGSETGQRSVDGVTKSRSLDGLPKADNSCGRSNSEPSISTPSLNTTTRGTTIELKTASSQEPADGGLTNDETDLSFEASVADPAMLFESSLNNLPAAEKLNIELTSVSGHDPLERDLTSVLESSLSSEQTSAGSNFEFLSSYEQTPANLNLEVDSISSHEQTSADVNFEVESISSYEQTSANVNFEVESISSYEQTSAGNTMELGSASSHENTMGGTSIESMMNPSHKPTKQYRHMELNAYPCHELTSGDLALEVETVLSCEPRVEGLKLMLETVSLDEIPVGDSPGISSLNAGSDKPTEFSGLTTQESCTGHEKGSIGTPGLLQDEASINEAMSEASEEITNSIIHTLAEAAEDVTDSFIHTLTTFHTECRTGSPTPIFYCETSQIISPSQIVCEDKAVGDDIRLSLDTGVQTLSHNLSIKSLLQCSPVCDHTQLECEDTSLLPLGGDGRTTVPSTLSGGEGQEDITSSLDGDSQAAGPSRLGGDGQATVPSTLSGDGQEDIPSRLGDDGQAAVSSRLGGDGQAAVPSTLSGGGQEDIPSRLGGDGQAAAPSNLGDDGQAAVTSSLGFDGQVTVPSSLNGDDQVAVPSSLGDDNQLPVPFSLGDDNQLPVPSSLGDDIQLPVLSSGCVTRTPARPLDIKDCVDGAFCDKCPCCGHFDFDSLKKTPEFLSCSQAQESSTPVFIDNETLNSLDKNSSRVEDGCQPPAAQLICSRCSGYRTYRGEIGLEHVDVQAKKYHRGGCCQHTWESPSCLDESRCSLQAGHVTLGDAKAYQSVLSECCEGFHRVDETINGEYKGVSLDSGGCINDEDAVEKINVSLVGTTIDRIPNVELCIGKKVCSAGCESCEVVSVPAEKCGCLRQEVKDEGIVGATAAAGSCHSSVHLSGSYSCCRWRSNGGHRQPTSETEDLPCSDGDHRTATVETESHQVFGVEHRRQLADEDSDSGQGSTAPEDKMNSIRHSADNSGSHTAQVCEEGETDKLVMSKSPAYEVSLRTANEVKPSRGAWVPDSPWCRSQNGVFLNHQHHCCCCHRDSCQKFPHLQTPATCHQQHLNHLATVKAVSQLRATRQPNYPMEQPATVCHRCQFRFSPATPSDGRISSAVADG